MIFRHLFFTVLLLLTGCRNLYANNFFAIRGNVSGLDKEWAYLDYLDDKNVHHTDSARVLRGSFRFMGALETPTFGILYFPASHIQKNFFFEPGFTFVEGDTGHVSFRGGNSTALFEQYTQLADSFSRYRASLTPYISGDKAAKDSAMHAQYMDDYYLSMSNEENLTEQFVRGHSDSYVSAYIILYKFSGESNINKGIALLNVLDPHIQKSKYCMQLLQLQAALNKSETGIAAPDFKEPEANGKMLRLKDIKAQYVLLDFWASWCGPCRRENPGLVQAYQKFHGKGFEIVSISFDQNKKAWINAITKDSLTWLNVCSFKGWDDEAAQLYQVSEIPTNFLIDKNGMIVAKNLLGTGLEYELGRLLGE